jgi:hypothetical protein
MDIMKAIIEGIEDRDHKRFVVNAGEELAEEIWDLMKADGYLFACSPAVENGQRAFYFTREFEPAPRM